MKAPHLVCPESHVRCVSALSVSVGTIVLNMLEMPVLASFTTKKLAVNFRTERTQSTLFVLTLMLGALWNFQFDWNNYGKHV